MKRLILMRHAEAGWHLNIDDHERPLSSLGIRDAEQVGSWLKEKNIFLMRFCRLPQHEPKKPFTV